MSSLLPVGKNCFVSKEFLARIDQSVAISIPHQYAVVGTGPSRACFDGVAVGIK